MSETLETLLRVRERILGYLASNNVYRVIEEEILKLDPGHKLTYTTSRSRRSLAADRNNLISTLREQNKNLSEALEKIAHGEYRTWDTTPLYEPYTGAQCSRIAQEALAENAKVLGEK